MNNYDIYEYVQSRLRRVVKGDVVKLDQFERDLDLYSKQLFSDEKSKFESGKDSTEALSVFKVQEEVQTTTALGKLAYTSLDSTYSRLTGVYYNDGTEDIWIDEITDLEYHDRIRDELTKPTSSHPVVLEGATDFTFKPAATFNAEDVYISYLKEPSTPLFDWVYDSNDNLLYMEAGWSIDGSNNLRDGVDGAGNVIAAGVTHPDSPSLPYNSTSVELEWGDEEKIIIANKILQAYGVELDEQDAVAYSARQEQNDLMK